MLGAVPTSLSPLVTVDVDTFAAARPRLLGIAYRMLGSWAEAEDVVGDVAERWATVDRDEIRQPEGWLVTVTTRRALDVARSARLQRVDYPGEWLPEPILTGDEPDLEIERAETLTMGFVLLLERLTPIERAVFVLHDALDYPYDQVAAAVGRSEAACRQALHRARRHVTLPARRTPAERVHAEEVAMRFMTVGLGGDVDTLLAALAPDVTVTSDGGGIVHAAMRTVHGRDRAVRFLQQPSSRVSADPLFLPCELNAEPGVVMHVGGVWLAAVVTVDGDRIIGAALRRQPRQAGATRRPACAGDRRPAGAVGVGRPLPAPAGGTGLLGSAAHLGVQNCSRWAAPSRSPLHSPSTRRWAIAAVGNLDAIAASSGGITAAGEQQRQVLHPRVVADEQHTAHGLGDAPHPLQQLPDVGAVEAGLDLDRRLRGERAADAVERLDGPHRGRAQHELGHRPHLLEVAADRR